MLPLQQTPIHVSDDILDDLRQRLTRTRWFDDDGNADGHYGVPTAYLRDLVDHWRTDFDWRAQEKAMNAYEHYRVEVDGVPIHFLRKPGVGDNPIPLILTHGWPWTFWHWSKVIDPLAIRRRTAVIPPTGSRSSFPHCPVSASPPRSRRARI
ncbi:epoxide hydrolase N-terminal domain-containing protein [Nocardia sp. NPDC059246]|uniref:epoxide hydrolase N-terminal domain-containing protein n=1 Tax=unclassified Nocardia TaxID=2637762 RepID=UPI0036B7D0BF